MTESFRFRTRSGRIVVLVPASAVRPHSGAASGVGPRDSWEQPRFSGALTRARDDSWSTSRDVVTVDLGMSALPGRMLWDGRSAQIDWDNLPMLSDVARKPSDLPPRPRAPEVRDPMDALLSFEVVDERGAPADGRYACTIDGAPNSGPLARTTHAFRELSSSARGRLRLEDLRWLDLPFDGPTPGVPTKPQVEPVVPAACGTSFEVLDEHGVPLRGVYRVCDDTGDREGALAGTLRVAGSGPARLRLRVEGPAPKVASP